LIESCHRAVEALDPERRYRDGQLITLQTLVSDFESRHFGASYAAAANLRAAISENHGFVPDDDQDVRRLFRVFYTTKTSGMGIGLR
jgi:nitrogen-specific signal transduction histidine kinase